jgi:hypothetical protein
MSCSRSGSGSTPAPESEPGLTISYEGTANQALQLTSGLVYPSTKTFSEPDGQGGFKQSQASNYTFYLANYELDGSSGAISLGSDLVKAGQLRVHFALVGREGTEAGGVTSNPVEVAEHRAKAERFLRVDFATISVFSGDKQVTYDLDESTIDGTVTINSVQGESVVGDINLKAGPNAIKGRFKAKVLPN